MKRLTFNETGWLKAFCEFALCVTIGLIAIPASYGQCERAKLLAQAGNANDQFGDCMAFSADGNLLLIGAPLGDHNCQFSTCDAGEVCVFARQGDDWGQQSRIISPNPPPQATEDHFGSAIGLSADGNTAVIGAPGESSVISQAGEAWIFYRTGNTWTHGPRLAVSNPELQDLCGAAVAISSDGLTVLVAARNNGPRGAVLVFVKDQQSNWISQFRLEPPLSDPFLGFGYGVAISGDGNLAMVGAPFNGSSVNGAVYVFTRRGTTWTLQSKLQSSLGGTYDGFGQSVSLNQAGTRAIILADSGKAFHFERVNNQWIESAIFPPNGEAYQADFATLSSDGRVCLIGSRYQTVQLNDEGAAYLYERFGNGWQFLGQVTPSDPAGFRGFGASGALSPDGLLGCIGSQPTVNLATTLSPAYVFGVGGTDADADGVPDECDNCQNIANAGQQDCDGNGIGDACAIETGLASDCNSNGVPDDCEIAAPPTVMYQLDDGVPENCIGHTVYAPPPLTWFNQFTIAKGNEVLVAIDIGWGVIAAGKPATLAVWSDPNNDGSPADAQLIASFGPFRVSDPNSYLVHTYSIPPTYIGPAGTRFFVGAHVIPSVNEYPALIDFTPPALMRSWITTGAGYQDFLANPPQVIGATNPGLLGQWIIRARTSPVRDCNGNGQLDECDLASGSSFDFNHDGVPDECQDLTCPADIAPFGPGGGGNGKVDVDDLLTIINRWGSCAAPCFPPCPGDIAPSGGDCIVDTVDLMAVISAWGDCQP